MAGTPAKKTGTTAKGTRTRVTVLVGQVKKKKGNTTSNVNVYSYMNKATAEYFGFKIETSATTTPSSKSGGNKKASPRLVRGSSGSGSIKVTGADKKTYSIPIPSGLTMTQIKAFLEKATKNKPEQFTSKNGRSYPVGTAKK